MENGIVLVPEDRKTQGIRANLGVGENITIGSLNKNSSKLGVLKRKLEREMEEKGIEDFKIKGAGFSFKEFVSQIPNMIVSALIGVGIGILPGIGGGVSCMISYTVSKNITTTPGMKTLYLRLTRPDGEVMTKDPANLFPFEDKEIAFSAKKDFEYAGEELHDVIYWKVEEILQIGSYRADFFIDGNHVGRLEFEIRK